MIGPAAFIEEILVNPESGEHFTLTSAERVFLSHAFTLTPDGRLKYPELLFSAPKKTGKTAFAAMCLLYVVLILGGRYGEAYAAANDLEQSQGRVFQAGARIVAASPLLAADATITQSRIEFASTGATITAIASDYAGAAGANPTITCFDELWAYTSERAHRLWDEMVPPPTRKIAARLTVTYAGYSGESTLLESIYKRGLAGKRIARDLYEAGGLLMYWTHDFTAPWQTDEWRKQMREQLRPNAYLRLIENRWVTSESTFVDLAWWDACVDPEAGPLVADKELPVYVGVDASVKRDSTAVVACAWDDASHKVRLVFHRIFQPSQSSPLDFEATIESTVTELSERFRVREVRYDPYQMQAVSQRLRARPIPMVEFPQTVSNLTEASTNLYELIKGRNLIAYPNDALRLAVQRSVAIETSRGWRIAKEKAAHKIDVVVALGMAALSAVHAAKATEPLSFLSAMAIIELDTNRRAGRQAAARGAAKPVVEWARGSIEFAEQQAAAILAEAPAPEQADRHPEGKW
jgi:phage terminase large subunit-like protein